MMQKYQDSSLSPEERARDLLARMDLDEKFGQIQCYNAIDSFLGKSVEKQNPYGVGQVCILIATMLDDVGSAAGLITRLQKQIMESGEHHIPAIFHIETLTGVMVTAATSFPCGLGQASTWDPEQQQKMAACIARQGRAMGISHALAPVFDICRDPRFGRMGETYGEDPTLAAAMGTAYVKGLQDKHRMSACSKHFLGFMAGQGGIHTAQAVVSPRELREVYAKPFQAAITEGKLDSVMNSYAAIDGQVPAGSKAILRDLLRGEMGFNGVTVSDYSAVEQLESIYHLAESPADAGRLALEAGMDQELPTIAAYNDELKENIRSGVVQESLLDEAVLRILTMKFRLGLFENPFPAENVQAEITPADTALNRKIAQESMILLKNDGVLPLAKSAKKVAVIGWHADSVRALFGGYSALAMKENTLGVKMSMAGIQADADSPAAENAVQKTYPGSEVVMENPGVEPLARRCYPDAYSMLGALRLAAPHTEFLYAQGYPYAGNEESGYDAALQIAKDADLVICTLGGHYGWNASCTTGEGIDAMHIGLPVCQERFLEKLESLHKPVVGVHFDGHPISSDTADRVCNAILEAWAPGAQGGEAIAALLTGTANPCGKLPCTVARHIFSRFEFRGKKLLKNAFLFASIVPSMSVQVMVYRIISALGVYNTRMAGFLLYIGTDIIAIYIFLQQLSTIPVSLDEAAIIDGASYFTVYRRIILPLLRPAITTIVIIKGVGIYNDFYIPYQYMPKNSLRVVATTLFQFKGQYGTQWEVICAGAIITVIPILIIFILLQKQIYNGLIQGSIK